MDVKELEKWLDTDDGKKWLEVQKKGLLDKNAELLEKLKDANGKADTLNERIRILESDLVKEQGATKELLISKPLAEKLEKMGVYKILIPELSKTITETYGLQIANGNAIGKVKEDGKETELNLDQIIDAWAKSDSAKDCLRPQDTKTQSTVPDFKGSGQPIDPEWAAMREAAGLPVTGE